MTQPFNLASLVQRTLMRLRAEPEHINVSDARRCLLSRGLMRGEQRGGASH